MHDCIDTLQGFGEFVRGDVGYSDSIEFIPVLCICFLEMADFGSSSCTESEYVSSAPKQCERIRTLARGSLFRGAVLQYERLGSLTLQSPEDTSLISSCFSVGLA